ncbi:MAG: nucleotidyltransferase domain-containing protein [bacterium]
MLKEYNKIVELFTQSVKERLKGRITSLAIYGSVARGKIKPGSDIDSLLIGEGLPENYHERVDLILPILDEIERSAPYLKASAGRVPVDIQFIILSKEEAKQTRPVFIDMVEDVKIMFDDGFLKEKLDQIRIRMAELGSKRVYLEDGSWYWDLKPDLVPGEVFEI